MASSAPTLLLLFIMIYCVTCILVLPPPTAAQESLPMDKFRVFGISEALFGAGYRAMSLTVEEQMGGLLQHTNATAITIFSPRDDAFFASKYPPLALLRSHTIPRRLDRAALKSLSSPGGAMLETLLPGHVLTAMTTTGGDHADRIISISINHVDVMHWDLYDDGGVIIHGINDVLEEEEEDEEKKEKEAISKKTLLWSGVGMMVVAVLVFTLSFFICANSNDDDDDGYTRFIAELDDEYGQEQQQQQQQPLIVSQLDNNF